MRRLYFTPLFVIAALGVIATAADAFPSGNLTLRHDWIQALSRFSPNFGIVEPGECILLRQETVDSSHRLHLRLVKVCD
jgi:hypothetical protein